MGAETDPPSRLRRRPLPRALAGGLSRPDPRAGVIETLAVDDGEPVALDLHLRRLAAAAREVLALDLPAGLRGEIEGAARGAAPGRHRLRIDVTGDDASIAVAPAPAPGGDPLAVVAVELPGGLGGHKWRDRALVEALARRHGAVPLIVDADGAVLEAAHANVVLVEGDALVTPPADGRLLPGITRARILAAAPGASEEPIDLDRLEAADAVLLTSSIALVRAVAGSRRPERAQAVLDLLGSGRPRP